MIPIAPSSPSWIHAALRRLPSLLLDHAHCEKKAATMALRHVQRHADWPGLAEKMSRLAREELVHFEQVLVELRRREISFRGQPGAGYGAALVAAIRPPSPPPPGAPGSWLGDRTVDEMLICAIIEARSHERLGILAAFAPDPRLADLYADLCAAEERHGSIYVALAAEAAGDAPVAARLAALCAHEATVIVRPGLPVRMHAGGVDPPDEIPPHGAPET